MITVKVLWFRSPKKMDFGNEISSNEKKLDFELFRNRIDCIHEGIIDDPHKILII